MQRNYRILFHGKSTAKRPALLCRHIPNDLLESQKRDSSSYPQPQHHFSPDLHLIDCWFYVKMQPSSKASSDFSKLIKMSLFCFHSFLYISLSGHITPPNKPWISFLLHSLDYKLFKVKNCI